jgi:hypothetical protein
LDIFGTFFQSKKIWPHFGVSKISKKFEQKKKSRERKRAITLYHMFPCPTTLQTMQGVLAFDYPLATFKISLQKIEVKFFIFYYDWSSDQK